MVRAGEKVTQRKQEKNTGRIGRRFQTEKTRDKNAPKAEFEECEGSQ